MATERLKRVEDLFDEVLDLPRDQWASFLDEACGDDDWVRKEVESLLSHHGSQRVDFLTPSADRVSVHSVDADRLIGKTIARFRIKQVLGSGGMGTVYLAEEERLSRDVAIKMLNLAWRHHPARHRFEWESRLLAQLHHPHIAQVFEAGTHEAGSDSVPYFVMEYIPQATSIIEYAKRKELGLQERLKLFRQVCDAVHHGHQKGIVHRDLKPSNLLVDQEGHIKVIDFGIARATDSDIAATTIVTDTGQIVGTLQYMSPEQIDGSAEAIDIRSDIYSLGVVMYELVCGELPYDVRGLTLTSAARQIQQGEIPAPHTVNRNLRGDLETIILSAMERNRDRRYPSASELAADIRRYLNNEPIAAKPPTPWTRFARLIARHPIAATTLFSALIAASIIASASVAVWYARGAPHDVQLSEDRSEARVISVTGNTIGRPWRRMRDGIQVARKVDIPSELGGGFLALIGFANKADVENKGELHAYEVSRNGATFAWKDFVDDGELPNDVVEEKKQTGRNFNPKIAWTFDVFDEYPGDEIVILYAHNFSRRLIRVLDLTGTPLFQFWHDGYISDCYWLSGPRLLVFAAAPADAVKLPNGSQQYYPLVFAVKPELGVLGKKYINKGTGDPDVAVAWYHYLGPKKLADLMSQGRINDAEGDYAEGEYCTLSVRSPRDVEASVGWVLDSDGNLVSEGPMISDAMQLDPDLMKLDWTAAYLGPEPPWLDQGP